VKVFTGLELPSWVADPGTFFDPPQPDVVVAVGKARTMGSGKGSKIRAEMDARVKLMVAKGDYKGSSSTTTDESVVNNGNSVERKTTGTTFRSSFEGKVNSGGTLAQWSSPDGYLYVLIK
jgi:hypothetical protein